MQHALIERTRDGLYCAAGDFHIDPWRPVPRAVITHAHADHARGGSARYYAARSGVPLLKRRLGADQMIEPMAYGVKRDFGRCRVSLHPAGHILGSSQIRVEYEGEVWVASGDYKRDPDPTCEPFEVVPCDTFITEATFALPVYRWPSVEGVVADIHDWWQANAEAGRASVLFTYSLGKAQRILAELRHHTDRTVYLHGAPVPLTEVYRQAGVAMVPTRPVSDFGNRARFTGELVLAPPSAAGSTWMRRFRSPSTGFASGWMRIRGNRRRRGYDRGFVLSDHADWPSLLRTFDETDATTVLTTHGRSRELIAYLRDLGRDIRPLATPYADEPD